MDFPEGLRYTSEHEWLRVEGSTAVVGVTDFAQDSLGDVVYVGLPEVGTEVEAAGACGEVESTKSVSDIYAPVAGEVSAVNEELAEQPELVNSDPYGRGWILVIEMRDPGAADDLMDAGAYRALVEQ